MIDNCMFITSSNKVRLNNVNLFVFIFVIIIICKRVVNLFSKSKEPWTQKKLKITVLANLKKLFLSGCTKRESQS